MRSTLLLTTGLVALSLLSSPVRAQDTPLPKAGAGTQAPANARGAEGAGKAQQGDAEQRPAARQKLDEQPPTTRSGNADEGAEQPGGALKSTGQEPGSKAKAAQSGEPESGTAGESKGTAERPTKNRADTQRNGESETRAQRQGEPTATRKQSAPGEADRNVGTGEAEQPKKAERAPAGNGTGEPAANREPKAVSGTTPQRNEAAQKQGGTPQRGVEGEGGGIQARGRLKIDEARASSVHQSFTRHRDGEIHDRSFRFSVGVAVPATIRLTVVPDEIVSQYPEFRGYDYVIEDDDVAIIEPQSREIVEVIGAGGERAAGTEEGGGGRSSAAFRFSGGQNEMIRRSVQVGSYTGERPVLRAPDSIELRPLPRDLAEQLHADAELGYFVDRENRIVVVNPQNREVLDIVD